VILAWLPGLVPVFAGAYMLYRESGWQGLKQLLVRCAMWKLASGIT
jgi:hypothetical protein